MKQPKYRLNQPVYFVTSGLFIKEAFVVGVRPNLYTLKYRADNGYDYGAIRLSENRVYATLEEAKAALHPFKLPKTVRGDPQMRRSTPPVPWDPAPGRRY